jgi:mercuric reductase
VKGIENVDYLTNEEALSLRELPQTLCVIGGRALALEFAQMYAQFGTRVTVLQRSRRILPDDEPAVSKALAGYMKAIGIKIKTGITVRAIENKGTNKVVKYTSKGKNFRVEAEQVLFATGRRPNTENLQLSAAGVETDENGFVKANNQMQTSAPNVWAAGDVTGEPMLETIAAKEGHVAVENAFSNGPKKKINFDEVPSAVFTYPEVARVGLTESQVIARGMHCNCVTLPFDLVPKAHVIADTRGLLKLVINNDTKRILGVHIVAPHAADLIHEGVLAVKFKMTIDDIIDTVHVFPTLSESTKLAAQSFYMDIGRLSCCIG